jgi:hypothetical protein
LRPLKSQCCLKCRSEWMCLSADCMTGKIESLCFHEILRLCCVGTVRHVMMYTSRCEFTICKTLVRWPESGYPVARANSCKHHGLVAMWQRCTMPIIRAHLVELIRGGVEAWMCRSASPHSVVNKDFVVGKSLGFIGFVHVRFN